MSCHAKNCDLGGGLSVEPCSSCGRGVHHVCSNGFFEGELSVRVCSQECAAIVQQSTRPTCSARVQAKERVGPAATHLPLTTNAGEIQEAPASDTTSPTTIDFESADTYDLQRLQTICRNVVPPEVRYVRYTGGRHKMWDVVYVLEKSIQHGSSIPMKLFFMEREGTNPFSEIADNEWTLVREIEGITPFLSELALSDVQSQTLLPSYMVLYRTMAELQLKSSSFGCLVLRPSNNGLNAEVLHERENVAVETFSKPAKICIARCIGQIRERFPKPSIHEVVTLLLDPRTKNCAAEIIDGIGYSSIHRDEFLEQAEDLIISEHMRIQELEKSKGVPVSSMTSKTPPHQLKRIDLPIESGGRTVFFGAPVPTKSQIGYQVSDLREAATADFRRWVHFQEDWLNVALTQDPKADRAVLSKRMCFKRGDGTLCWNLPDLSKVDILRWFREVGEPKFPTIATLARIWLGKVSSTAFQERVFSTAGIVMAPSRSSTDNHRAEKQLLLRVNRQEIESSTTAVLQ